MKWYISAVLPLLTLTLLTASGCKKEVQCNTIHIVHTTDVHGNLLPYDFVNDRPGRGSYARVASYVKGLEAEDQEVLLLDAGDILQGQPIAYYYNYVDTVAQHPFAKYFEQCGYDAITIGNHDIETGHSVYDRFVAQLRVPILGANVVKTDSDQPYFLPYVILKTGGRRIAVIGTTMPGLVNNLPEQLWSGLRFDDQVETVRKYLPEIKASEPDLIVALIHSGSGSPDGQYYPKGDNVGYQMARELPDIDLILLGHDHRALVDSVVHRNGGVTYLLNPGSDAMRVSHTEVFFCGDKERRHIRMRAELVSMDEMEPDATFGMSFRTHEEAVSEFVSQPIGRITRTIDARSSFFRPTYFTDLIHQVQRFVFPQAEISLTAPLDFDVELDAGEVAYRDLFKMYRYENRLYLMVLSGKEIKGTLEESYGRWIETMERPTDRLIQIDESRFGGQYLATKNASFNFDSASGMTYTVDATKPKGERVSITAVGEQPFELDGEYLVAVNSYRGSGGGGLLTEGGGIPIGQLRHRIIATTDRDLRHYFMLFLQQHNPYTPVIKADWAFVPKDWIEPAIQRDSTLLFSNIKK
ncbi:MAG: bifunctional UDP-sugar hydrolase/5'-nucleotidase [Porphyromonas sp.]|nr:bifunctional UDP-sugar hydrolase/5'-nucleotidase [Porphyromonas sp.]